MQKFVNAVISKLRIKINLKEFIIKKCIVVHIHASKSAPSNIILGTIIKNLKNTNILPIFIPLKSLESCDVCYIIIFCSLYKLIIPVLFVHFYFKLVLQSMKTLFPLRKDEIIYLFFQNIYLLEFL